MKKRILELEQLIKHHKALYYAGRPEITDSEFDSLEEEIRDLDTDNPVLSIVGHLAGTEKKIIHETKMLSLDKTYEKNDLKEWIGERQVLSVFKIDGVSCSLIYRDGKFFQGKTRGDGTYGEDITAKILWMSDIPKTLSEKKDLEIRGELYCTEESFFDLSNEMEITGLDRPSSKRNIVAGLVLRKDRLELCRYVKFQGFDCMGIDCSFEEEKYHLMTKWGFSTPDWKMHKDFDSTLKAIKDAENFMANGHYQIDGLVIVFNDLDLHDKLGSTAHHPRFKIAFKFKGESRETVIEDIVWSVSRNGVLTPVGKVKPVELSGAMISKVSFHNYGLVKQFGLKKEDKIEIIRSGEVIPKFLSVIESADSLFKVPDSCPSCKKSLIKEKIRLICSNESCPGKAKEEILYFIQKMGIEDISVQRLHEMMEKNLICRIEDLYLLKKEDFFKLDKVKEKLAEKFYHSIQKSKNTDLVTLLCSLGIAGSAVNKCQKIVDAKFNTIEKLKKMTVEDLCRVDSFAEKSADIFVKSLTKKIPLMEKLKKQGLTIRSTQYKKSPLSGKTICITGSLSEKRLVVEDKIKKRGGRISGSISQKTDFLLTNETDSTSAKFKKAKKWGISIIDEEKLKKILQT